MVSGTHAENRLVSVTVDGQTTEFIYNGDGMMVKKIDSEGTTTYIGSIYEIHVDNEEVETTTTYYPAAGAMRVKQGDTVEGFKLAEVGDKRVIFSNGASRVELVLDYFRKVDARPATAAPAPAGQIRQPSPVAPRVVPALPRRQRTPMVYEGDSNS